MYPGVAALKPGQTKGSYFNGKKCNVLKQSLCWEHSGHNCYIVCAVLTFPTVHEHEKNISLISFFFSYRISSVGSKYVQLKVEVPSSSTTLFIKPCHLCVQLLNALLWQKLPAATISTQATCENHWISTRMSNSSVMGREQEATFHIFRIVWLLASVNLNQ